MRFMFPAAVAILGFLVPARAADPYADLYDLDRLCLTRPNVRTLQVSSKDPTGGNADWGHVVRSEGATRVLADLRGPGVVRRIWSANPSGTLRIALDDAPHPIVEVPFASIFEGKIPEFPAPLSDKSSGGWYCYVPITFRSRCLITVTGGEPFYYQVTWQKTPSAPDRAGIGGEADGAREEAVRRWSHRGDNPPDETAIAFPERDFYLPPGGTWRQPVHGPGTITEVRFRFDAGTSFEDLRRAILRIQFDGNAPAVEAPIGDFFGVGFEDVRWKSLALGYDEDGAYCFFRMPFRKTAVFEVQNQGKRAFSGFFQMKARPSLPAGPWGFFHASYRNAVNEYGQHYIVARLRGAGHIVGVTHSMRGVSDLWFLEGDEKIYVDGEALPSIHGTGTEDYYNCGWYFNTGPVNVATHGCTYKTEDAIGAYRMHVPDPIPFSRSLDFLLEHGGTNDAPGSEYSSVVYWYGSGTAKDAGKPLPKGSELMPRGLIRPVPGITEAEHVEWNAAKGLTVRRQSWHAISPFRGGGRMVFKGRLGMAAATPFQVPFADRYDVEVYLSGMNTDSTARILIDGQAVGEPVRDTMGPIPIRKVTVGSALLTAGRHTLSVRIGKGSAIALDGFRLSPRSPLVRDYAVLGPFPVDPARGVDTPLEPDGDIPELGRSYPSPNGPLHWRIMQAPGGILKLDTVMEPNTNAVAYAAFAVHSPDARRAELVLGSDDGVAAWVNGGKVLSRRVLRALTLDEDSVPISLQAGWNTVVLKVDQAEVSWEVAARVSDPDGVLEFAALPSNEDARSR